MDNLLKPILPCTATALTLKYRIFYEFFLEMQFKVRELEGMVGVQFRLLFYIEKKIRIISML